MGSLNGLIEAMRKDVRRYKRSKDRINDDGLIVCGRCGEQREFFYDLWEPEYFSNGDRNSLIGTNPRYVIRTRACRCDRDGIAAEEETKAEREAERERRQMEAAAFDMDNLRGVTFRNDDMKDPEASRIARSFVENFDRVREAGQGMVFSGGTGSGKTYMAAMVANELLSRGRCVKVTNLAIMNRKMNEYYGANAPEIIGYLSLCDLVVIDDLGAERGTSTAKENAYQVADCINANKIPVIVTTNLNGAEIFASADESDKRIYSRLLERCRPVTFRLDDRRIMKPEGEWEF